MNRIIYLFVALIYIQPLMAGNTVLFGSISGTVKEKTDGKPIAGASISIPDLKIGTFTDAEGNFTLNFNSKGLHLVEISFVGYATVYKTIDLNKTSTLDIQMSISNIETDEVVVTGVSRATELKRTPIPIVALSKTFLQEHAAATNIIDAVANVPGVSAVTTGPNISKPFIHGLGYNRVVTAEDGIRQEGQQWGDEHGIEVDQNSIDRVEIIKGPASLSYGSDAIGGVVNLITPSPVPQGKILGYVSGIYGTNNGMINSSVRLQGNENGFVWGLQASQKAAKDYQNERDGRNWATNFNEKDARVMLGLNKKWGYSYLNASLFDDLQAIPDGSRDSATRKFTYQITDADTTRPIVSNSMLNSYSLPTLHQHVQLYRIYDVSSFALGNGNLNVNLGWQYSHRREFTHPTAPDIPGLNLQLTTYNYDIKYNFDLGGYETSVGVNGMYQNNALGYSTDFPIPAYHQFDIGAFLVEKKTYEKFDLLGGVRFDTRSFSGQGAYIDTSVAYYPSLYKGPNPTTTPNVALQFSPLNKTFSGLTGSIGATYNVTDHFLVKANIARGYRAPSIAELSANGPDPGSQIYHVGNSNFKPEFSVQGDFGVALSYPFLTASVSFFDNNIQNYIFQEQLLDANGNPKRVNADGSPNPNGQYSEFSYVQSKARIDGGEAYLDIHPVSWLHFENALTLTYGTNLSNGGHAPDSLKYLPFIPPLHTHTELRTVDSKKGFGRFKKGYIYVGFDHYDAQNRFFAAYGTETYTAGYNLLSAGLGVNLVNAAGKNIVQLFIEGTNLANINYQSNMSRLKYFDNPVVPPGIQPGMFNMGRNITFKVIVPFDLSPKNS
ncbi:TonB-dependent receptor [Dinghuibacter silviterrae]|uniref:Iron complex outermembrane receptor protein n=1 Tax=Dinghuibacter silviterrae TaxID=1539049 RepID=A0A4V3GLD1_9BACT|nr:TonB-dependent receptor [Dinghuibacter silviterrae]TDW99102.1 iron complex outermembrane receptor protein [Dinghuibacter silviterrae]